LFKDKIDIVQSAFIKAIIIISLAAIVAILLGAFLSRINNMEEIENLLENKRPSLPSVLLDRNGLEITKYYSDEKKDIVTLDNVPDYLVQGLILWEDSNFYKHHGFNLSAIIRAFFNNLIGKPISGASTLTQQLARTLFLNREFSITRKIKELWIAFQLEKRYTKNEILTLYLNNVPFGQGTNGVQAASRLFFDKDVQDITYAEAASLITVISNPTFYSFVKFPKNHKQKQKEVLKKMVKYGVITQIEAEKSFNEFWITWQNKSETSRGAFFNREDKAPYFSDWVLQEIQKNLPNVNVFKDGLVIHSTLDIKTQELAQKILIETVEKQQPIFENEHQRNYKVIQNYYIDTIGLLGEMFSLSNVNVGANRGIKIGLIDYKKKLNFALNLTSQLFGIDIVESLTDIMMSKEDDKKESLFPQVRGATVMIENETGHILVMVGGKEFDPNNRFNYAMQSRRQPGSAFKPLYYSAALDTGIFNAASVFMDKETVFTFDSDDPDDWYTPYNFGAKFYGKVSFRRALRKSLNIPSCQIFYAIGKDNKYKVPIDRAALLLGITSQKEIEVRFQPELSTALGTGVVAPIEMAQAFSVFANLGQKRIPISILYIEDRDGNIIYNPWKEMQKYYRENSKKLQIITKQNAFIMTSILRDTVHNGEGFLSGAKQRIIESGKEFPDIELAAKTGTAQNSTDVWCVGFSKEVTLAMWLGFKEFGLSLGQYQNGSAIHGPNFLEIMRYYHLINKKYPLKFERPEGVISMQVCAESGLKPSPYCNEETLYYEYFLPQGLPKGECNICKIRKEQEQNIIDKYSDKLIIDSKTKLFGEDDVKVNKSLLDNYETKDIKIEGLHDVKLFNDDDSVNVDDLLKEDKNKTNQKDQENITTITTTIEGVEEKKENDPLLKEDKVEKIKNPDEINPDLSGD